jgi:hypothetical protein
MSARRPAALLAVPLLLGCSVGALDRSAAERVQNTCEDSSECGDGFCIDSICQASGAFNTVLFEVTPPAMSGRYTGVPFLKTVYLNKVEVGGVDLSLTSVATVTGTVGPDAKRPCAAGGALTVPARITFTPTERLLGLAVAPYITSAALDPDSGRYEFRVRVPPGAYDIYVEPDAAAATGECPVVAQLYRRQVVAPALVELPLGLPEPRKLNVRVLWPETQGPQLAGWTVDVVDPLQGQLISNTAVLDVPVESDAGYEYVVDVLYSPVTGGTSGEDEGRELVRLKPPTEVSAPTLLMERAGLELFKAGEAVINQLTQLPAVVEVQGQLVTATEDHEPVRGTISVVATKIDGLNEGTIASFRRSFPTEVNGRFAVTLLPGKYRVHAEPSRQLDASVCSSTATPGLGVTSVDWDINGSPLFQAGRTIEVPEMVLLTGEVFAPLTGEPLAGSSLHAVPSPCATGAHALELAVGDAPYLPRSSSIAVCPADGRFAMAVDRGVYDVSLRPPEGSALPWLLAPSLVVEGAESAGVRDVRIDIGTVEPPLPVRYQGFVTVPRVSEAGAVNDPLPGSVIRAYAFVDADGRIASAPEKAAWVMLLGETRAGDQGQFELFLPSSLAAEPSRAVTAPGRCF